MINYFSKKLNKKGFTLAELLIVVAIIAVLVAVAIPIYTGALEKARYGVHKSNARSLKSMGVADILASAGFDSHATTVPAYQVDGSYNFATEKFTIKSVTPLTDASKAGNMYLSDGASSYYQFDGTAAEITAIGKIPTSKDTVAYYRVIITATDFDQVEPGWTD